MKRALCLIMAVMLLMTGCAGGNKRNVNLMETVGEESIRLSYDLLTDEKIYEFSMPQDGSVRVSVTTESGKLSVVIGEAGKDPVYEGRITEDFSFTLNVPAGVYRISLTGESHKGTCEFDWQS